MRFVKLQVFVIKKGNSYLVQPVVRCIKQEPSIEEKNLVGIAMILCAEQKVMERLEEMNLE